MKRPNGCSDHSVGAALRDQHVHARLQCLMGSVLMHVGDPILYALRLSYAGPRRWYEDDVAEAFGVAVEAVVHSKTSPTRWVQ